MRDAKRTLLVVAAWTVVGTIAGACGRSDGSDAGEAAAAGAPERKAPDALRSVFFKVPDAPDGLVEPTPAMVALGRALYHDERLSANGDISCASCHDLEGGGDDGRKVSLGTAGQAGERNAPSTLNAYLHEAQFWDGRAATVETQAQGPMMNPIEHGLTQEGLEQKLRDHYGQRFDELFGGADAATLENFGAAIGAFERTLRTWSRFDEWVEGNDSALTDEEKEGARLFALEVGCATCHNMRTIGGQSFRKLGEVNEWPTEDLGRYEVTGEESDKHVFKVPSLLNVAETAPYLHDGSVATLPEMVRKMAWHQLGKELTDEQVAKIVAFLETTTGALVE